MLAKVFNDDVVNLTLCGELRFFASWLAPTGDIGRANRLSLRSQRLAGNDHLTFRHHAIQRLFDLRTTR